ncbi:type VII toxin-antitoxin system HepT family RNase toxin [Sporanaerobacter acetigenes]|uniref:type VII toxin-antitoxin system HepT family RNase toxin n=1 Tax=Sporanaerobacter acetigenes TaxID=165813 RepID=UPI00332BD5D9
MINIEVIKQRLNQLSTSINKIERFKEISLEEFLKDDIIQDVVEYNLFIAINMMIDIATHIVVDNNMGSPETLGEAFNILNKEKYLNDEETKVYRNMVDLRNILSHEYINIDKKIIYSILKNNLIDIKKFVIFVNDNFI